MVGFDAVIVLSGVAPPHTLGEDMLAAALMDKRYPIEGLEGYDDWTTRFAAVEHGPSFCTGGIWAPVQENLQWRRIGCEDLGETRKQHRESNGDGVSICQRSNDACNCEASECCTVCWGMLETS
ncbi:unnamed protein product [Sphagnum balticum]